MKPRELTQKTQRDPVPSRARGSVNVPYCRVDSSNNENEKNIYFGWEKLNSWPQSSERRKRKKSRDLLIIHHMSLPLKYGFNTRCYVTRQTWVKRKHPVTAPRSSHVWRDHASIFTALYISETHLALYLTYRPFFLKLETFIIITDRSGIGKRRATCWNGAERFFSSLQRPPSLVWNIHCGLFFQD
jgi:hypothetical protein